MIDITIIFWLCVGAVALIIIAARSVVKDLKRFDNWFDNDL